VDLKINLTVRAVPFARSPTHRCSSKPLCLGSQGGGPPDHSVEVLGRSCESCQLTFAHPAKNNHRPDGQVLAVQPIEGCHRMTTLPDRVTHGGRYETGRDQLLRRSSPELVGRAGCRAGLRGRPRITRISDPSGAIRGHCVIFRGPLGAGTGRPV